MSNAGPLGQLDIYCWPIKASISLKTLKFIRSYRVKPLVYKILLDKSNSLALRENKSLTIGFQRTHLLFFM